VVPAPTEAVAATEEAPTEEAAAVSIALFHTVLGNTYTKAVSDGVEDAAARLGATVDVFGSDPPFDATSQSHPIQDAIISG
jgi:ABC-type sugar transport system substrate-binding protein